MALRAYGGVEPLAGGVIPTIIAVTGGALGSAPNATSRFSRVTVWHYYGGIEGSLYEADTSQWNVTGILGLGASTFTIGEGTDFTKTYISTNVGAALGYRVSPHTTIFLRPEANVFFPGATDFSGGGDNNLQDPQTLWTLSVSAGLRVRVK